MKRLSGAVLFEVLLTSLAVIGCGQSTAALPGNSPQASATLTSASCPPKIRIIDLGAYGRKAIALAVNESGQVVGWSPVPGDSIQGFFWTKQGGLVELGSLGGGSSEVSYVNASGVVVGYSTTTGGQTHAASWTMNGGWTDLGTLGGAISVATMVSPGGQIVGTSGISGDQTARHPFSWTKQGGMVDLGTLGGTSSGAAALNGSGQVVGSSTTGAFSNTPPYPQVQHAFSWTKQDGMVDLTPNVEYGASYAVNESGQVVGIVENHVFSWTKKGGLVDLGTLGGTYSGFLNYGHTRPINARGEIIGFAYLDGDLEYHAFLWTQQEGMIDLGTLGGCCSTATAVSNSGKVVGYSSTASGDTHPFLWTKQCGMVDLGTLGGSYGSAVDVNSSGLVVGWGRTATNEQHATAWETSP